MKKAFILTLVFAIALPLYAQHDGKRPEKRQQDITEIVSDLSATQKIKVENVTKESKTRVRQLRDQQKAVRDSISFYMNCDGDQSRLLFPLFDREARLQVEINREMYNTKLCLDEMLTPAQREELHKTMSTRKKKK